MEQIIKISSPLILSFLLAACGSSDKAAVDTSDEGNDSSGGTLTLKTATSDAALETQIKASLLTSYGTINNPYTYALESGTVAEAVADSLGSAVPDTSSTNTQESSVDEADRVKTDGNYLYVSSVTQPSISIFKAETGSAPLVAKQSLATLNDVTISGLYLRDAEDQIIAISGDGQNPYFLGDMWFGPYYWQSRTTEVFDLDVSNPTAPAQQSKLSIDGQLISSRRIGSYLYLATRHTPYADGLIAYPSSEDDVTTNKEIINTASLSDLLPSYQIDDGAKQNLFESGDCFLTDYDNANNSQSSIISVVAINLDAASPVPEATCFVGDAETLYVSEKALYLATTGFRYDTTDGVSTYSGVQTTEIHKFALDGTDADYKGSTSVSGHLGWQQDLKPFRMSEYNDVLRIITYTGAQQSSVDSPAHLYTVAENATGDALEVIGELPNENRTDPLGKTGEQIYASRFIGDKGYLVTFRATDPLYVIDLSNPADPFIASALEIDGYSDYLHPVGENYLLGIGKDAIADTSSSTDDTTDDGRGAWYQGVKLSLIDISNPQDPFEKETIIIGGRGTETAVSQSHHALTTLQSGTTLKMALPVSVHETENSYAYYDESDPRYFYRWTRDELYRLNIDTESGGITLLPSIVGQSRDSEHYYYTQYALDRSVMIGDEVYYFHEDEVLTTADISAE